MNNPFVTVFIPSYNHEKYVKKAIQSVLDQTYDNIELIVIDDGSTDNSVEIIKKLAEKNEFKFIVQENTGLTPTLNKGVQLAKGEFFCELSSDDHLQKTYIKKQVTFMQEQDDIAMVAASLIIIDATGEIQENKHKSLTPKKYDFDDIMFKGCNVPAPGMLFRTAILADIGGFNPNIQLEDWQIQLKLTSQGHLITINPDAKVYYRLHGENNVLRASWMADQMLATINEYSEHKDFPRIRKIWYLRLFKKLAKVDKKKAKEFLPQVLKYFYMPAFWHGVRRLLLNRY